MQKSVLFRDCRVLCKFFVIYEVPHNRNLSDALILAVRREMINLHHLLG